MPARQEGKGEEAEAYYSTLANTTGLSVCLSLKRVLRPVFPVHIVRHSMLAGSFQQQSIVLASSQLEYGSYCIN